MKKLEHTRGERWALRGTKQKKYSAGFGCLFGFGVFLGCVFGGGGGGGGGVERRMREVSSNYGSVTNHKGPRSRVGKKYRQSLGIIMMETRGKLYGQKKTRSYPH